MQNFRAVDGVRMASAPEPDEATVTDAVALARLILDADVSLQAPPNLNPSSTEALLAAGVNDFGGISPVTPDYINPRHPWPHLEALAATCARAGFVLRPRAPIYDRFVDDTWLDPRLHAATRAVQARLRVAVERARASSGVVMSLGGLFDCVDRDVRAHPRSLPRRRRAVGRRRAPPVRRQRPRAARAPRRGRRAAPPPGRRRGHLRRQPQRQLHQRLRQGLPLLRVLAHPAQRRGLLPRRRGDRAPRRRGARRRRHRGVHPGGPRARARRQLLRRAGARHQARRARAAPARVLARGGQVRRRAARPADRATSSPSCTTPASARCPARRPRCSTTSCAIASRPAASPPPSGSRSSRARTARPADDVDADVRPRRDATPSACATSTLLRTIQKETRRLHRVRAAVVRASRGADARQALPARSAARPDGKRGGAAVRDRAPDARADLPQHPGLVGQRGHPHGAVAALAAAPTISAARSSTRASRRRRARRTGSSSRPPICVASSARRAACRCSATRAIGGCAPSARRAAPDEETALDRVVDSEATFGSYAQLTHDARFRFKLPVARD